MTNRLRLLAVTGTRADYGLWSPILRATEHHGSRFEVRLLVTAMHLDPRFGATVSEIRAAGHAVAAEVACTPAEDGRVDMARAVGDAVSGMADAVLEDHPDWLLLLGDRGEQLAAAIVALHLGVPVAHLHGGERTLGAVDDAMRDMVSRIAHLHLVATQAAGERLLRLGEEAWRVKLVGAPGLDDLRQQATADLGAVRRRVGLPPDGPYLLVVQHPETVGESDPAETLRATLAAVSQSGLPAVAIGPNADAGGRAMSHALAGEAGGHHGAIRFVVTLPRAEYAVLLANAAALVGNSSSGIIEAPLLGVPAVNVGDRQSGRTRGDNVIDVVPNAQEIAAGIARALDPAFRAGLSHASPYGDGGAAGRILGALVAQPIDTRLLVKQVGAPVE